MSEYISVVLRDAIRERAGFQCEYCLLPEAESFFRFEPDHFEFRDGLIVPQTDIGRVTEHLLQLNRPKLISIRRQLLAKGRYPPGLGSQVTLE